MLLDPSGSCLAAQERLSAVERRAYALQKERDSLRRQVDKLNGLNDIIRERDSTIQQVCPALHLNPAHHCTWLSRAAEWTQRC